MQNVNSYGTINILPNLCIWLFIYQIKSVFIANSSFFAHHVNKLNKINLTFTFNMKNIRSSLSFRCMSNVNFAHLSEISCRNQIQQHVLVPIVSKWPQYQTWLHHGSVSTFWRYSISSQNECRVNTPLGYLSRLSIHYINSRDICTYRPIIFIVGRVNPGCVYSTNKTYQWLWQSSSQRWLTQIYV